MSTENKILPQGLEKPNPVHQTRWLKAIILGVLSVIGFGLTWYFLDLGLSQNLGLIFWFLPSVLAALSVAFLCLFTLVDVNKYLFWSVNAAILILYLLLLPKVLSVALGGIIFFGFVWLFERHVREDEHSRADFEINRILRSSIIFMIYGLLMVLGFNIYNQIQTKFQENPDAVYKQIGNWAAEGLQFVPQGVGNFNPNQSFDDFISHQAQERDPSFDTAPKTVRQEIIDAFKQQLEDKFNVKVSGNPLLGEIVAGAVASKVKSISGSYNKFFPAIFALLIVIALRYTAFLFVWLTSIICWSLFKLLLAFNFFRIAKVQVEVDKLQI